MIYGVGEADTGKIVDLIAERSQALVPCYQLIGVDFGRGDVGYCRRGLHDDESLVVKKE